MKVAIPKDIATMTDEAHDSWVRSLTAEQYDRIADRTFRIVEYSVNFIDEYGDSIDCDYYDTLALAKSAFDAATIGENGVAAIVLEKKVSRRNVIDRGNLEDTDYTIVETFGDGHALEAGGWES